jgi:hypothetical protein
LRKAFDDTMSDPALLAEAKSASLEIAPMKGNEVKKLIGEIYDTPKDVVAKARAIVK